MLAIRIDRSDQFGQSGIASARDLLEPLPECVLETHAGLVAGNDDGALDDRRFHPSSPVSTRCWSRSWRAFVSRAASRLRSALLRPCNNRLAAAFFSLRNRFACLRAARSLMTSPIQNSTIIGRVKAFG